MIELVESSAASDRLRAAGEFIGSFGVGTEVLLIGATREAVDDLARSSSIASRATFGLHRFSLTQLAAHLAAADLAARALAPSTVLAAEALAARTVFDSVEKSSPSYFAPVARFPGFARALARTLAELRLAGVGEESLRALDGAGRSLGDLLAGFEERLAAARLADRAELLRIAARVLDQEPAPALATAPMVLLDVEVASAVERDFVAALTSASPSVLATVPAGDQRTAAAFRRMGAKVGKNAAPAANGTSLERLREHLFSDETPPAAELDDGVRFFSAPGEGREAIEIARYALEQSRAGVPFDDMAVFLRMPGTYSTLLQTAFRRAGIPAYFARGTRRPDPAGRAFLALLACAAEGLSAKRFAEYLSFGQTPRLDREGRPPSGRAEWTGADDEMLGTAVRAARSAAESEGDAESGDIASVPAPWKWEDLLVEASVIGSYDRWVRRLTGLENELALRRDELASEEPDSALVRRLERQLAEIGHLKRFALPIIERLAALPASASWGEWLAALAALSPMALRRPERVLRALAELEPMAGVGPVAVDEVRDVLADRLSFLEEDPPAERYGRIFVGSPEHARGRSFHVVFVPGLAERIFPQRPREDPLLLDAYRVRLVADLETQAERGQRERLVLRLAVGSARGRLYVSYPRVDVVEARPRVPSFYGLDVVRATSGALPDIEELERRLAAEANARLAWPAPPAAEQAIDPVEHDLATLWRLLHATEPAAAKGRARYLLELNAELARSLRARFARWEQKRWSELDGLVRKTDATEAALAAQRLGVRPYSVSALEKFASCPYRFVLAAIHRLAPRREIGVVEQLDPLTRGRLFHRVQAETLHALAARGLLPPRPDSREAEAILAATLDRIAEELRDELNPPIRRVWDDELSALRADLTLWLRHLGATAETWHPRYFELGFGLPPGEGRDAASVRETVNVPPGAKLRGAVDLVEASPDGARLRVTDHKTGADRTASGLVVGGGETLQPVLYALAVEAALGVPVAEGRLFFCTSRGGFAERVVVIDERARAQGREVLEIIDRALADGFLPPAPRAEACALCDFRVVCGPHEEERVLRHKDQGRLADLTELRGRP